jgi:uncharacterized protein YndB with AHSA1/START domain
MNLNPITLDRPLQGSPEAVWRALTQQAFLSQWLGDVSTNLTKEATFTLGLPLGGKTLTPCVGLVKNMAQNAYLDLTLENQELGLNFHITLRLSHINGVQRLSLSHEGFEAEGLKKMWQMKKVHASLTKFWKQALNKLEYHLEQV